MDEIQAPAGRPARMTPYELVFGDTDFDVRLFPAIDEEAEAYGVDPTHPDRFNFLPRVGEILRSVVSPDAPPEALDQYRALLYHAFNFWCHGKCLYLIEPAVARFVVEAAPSLQGWDFDMPRPSVYLQLPANLFWASISADGAPEPVDGVFVTAARSADALGVPYQQVELLLVLGIRRDRAGFSIIPFSTEVGPGIAQEWAAAEGRAGSKDFENLLPGGELAGLYSILTASEALKLSARSLWYIDEHPGALTLEHAIERRDHERPGSPPLSALSFKRVTLSDPPEPSALPPAEPQ
jgi:hypothetical protein